MQRLLLVLAVVLGVTMGAQAQDAGAVPPAKAGAPSVVSEVAPAQPIAFNHKLHVETAKLGCNDCHAPSKNGATLAMPQPTQCMLCHAAIATDKPDIQRLAAAAKANANIAWVRVYRVPSFVTFSHKTHTGAGAKCEECHGQVAQAVAIAPVKDMSMGGCIACHQEKSAAATCDTCHEIQSKNGISPFGADANVLARLHLAAPAQVTSSVDRLHAAFTGRAAAGSLTSFLRAPLL